MNDDINQAMQRTRQYWFIDGLTEMAFGGLCLTLAVYFLGQAVLPRQSFLYRFLDAGFVVIMVVAALFAGRIVKRVKQRLVFPRTGYVAYQPLEGRWLGAVASLAAVIAAVMVLLVINAGQGRDWMALATGGVLGLAWLVVGWKTRLARFYLLGLVSALLGGLLALLNLGGLWGLIVYYVLEGLSLLLSGGLTLRRYLKSTP